MTIPVFGNGDVWQAADGVRMMAETGCDGVVVGRGCLGNPWLFRDLAAVFAGGEPGPVPVLGEVAAVMLEHAELLVDWAGERSGISQFRKHTSWYLTAYPVGGGRAGAGRPGVVAIGARRSRRRAGPGDRECRPPAYVAGPRVVPDRCSCRRAGWTPSTTQRAARAEPVCQAGSGRS